MRIEAVEILSDTSNMAVMRHPGRNFPGVLVQGDTLDGLVRELEVVLAERNRLSEEAAGELEDVYDRLAAFLAHYTSVLRAHALELPFGSADDS
jgi:hypothetical protein